MTDNATMFNDPERYDRGINWDARLKREIPVLTEVFGPPGSGGVLDAGCGPGRQATALAGLGYPITGLDADAAMVEYASGRANDAGVAMNFVHGTYREMTNLVAGGFDGVYCLANSLAAAGERRACQEAVRNFATVLRAGGRLFVQILNFRAMRGETPCVRGPRVAVCDGVEYVSVRHFTFGVDTCRVTNVTTWKDGTWHQQAHGAVLFPVDVDDITQWCGEAGLGIDALYGSYAKEPFHTDRSVDLIVVATKAES